MGVSMEQPFYGLGSGGVNGTPRSCIRTSVRYYRSVFPLSLLRNLASFRSLHLLSQRFGSSMQPFAREHITHPTTMGTYADEIPMNSR
jgi:hypothetical protein